MSDALPAAVAVALPPLPEIYDRVRRHVPPIEWPVFADDVDAILALKRERNAVILAHNYRRRRSSTASPTSSATAWRWRARR